jgi:ribosomal protein S18 acetylase RimI-like enzyme
MIERVRLIKQNELEKLLRLYEHLNLDDPVLKADKSLKKHWKEILSDPNYFYMVVEEEEKLVSSCNLTVIKNLTRATRPYGLIKNVVTHPDYRKRGYGSAVLKKAVEIAQENNCYKVC